MSDWDLNQSQTSSAVKAVEDWDVSYNFETILLYGKPKVGKTFAYMSLIEDKLKENPQTKFYLICTDNGAARTFKEYFKEKTPEIKKQIKYFPLFDAEQITPIADAIIKEVKPADWVIVDLISDLWEYSQDKFVEQMVGAYGGDLSKYLISASQDTKKFGMFTGMQWGTVKRYNEELTKRLIVEPVCNVFCVASEKDMAMEEAIAEAVAKKKREEYEKSDIATMFEKIGSRPGGHKLLSYKFNTVVYISGIIEKQFQIIGDRGFAPTDKEFSYGRNFWNDFKKYRSESK